MKTVFIIFYLCLRISTFSYSQNTRKLNVDSVLSGYKNNKYLLESFKNTDLSFLYTNTPNRAIVGFIGDNYSRFQIVYTAMKQRNKTMTLSVTGYTRKWDTIRYFSGTMEITNAYYTEPNPDFPDTIKEGMFAGTYNFSEATNELFNAGFLRGSFITYWYTDKTGHLHYDDLNSGDDDDCNNQFTGIWEEYRRSKKLKCNWGDYRIPNCGNLDEGVGEFAVDSSYTKFGWQNFKGTEFDSDTTIEAQEKADAWWPIKK
jgi:hypothetical protein